MQCDFARADRSECVRRYIYLLKKDSEAAGYLYLYVVQKKERENRYRHEREESAKLQTDFYGDVTRLSGHLTNFLPADF